MDTRLVLLLCHVLLLNNALGQETTTFLPDDATVETPHDLGAHPYLCVGDIRECPEGFTLSWWFEVPAPDTSVPAFYFLSSGGQAAASNGLYVRRNFGREVEVGVAVEDRLWVVSMTISDGQLTHMLMAWSPTAGLTVYVDGLVAGQDLLGGERVATLPLYDQYTHLILGAPNDDAGDTPPGSLRIFEITHWTVPYEQADVNAIFGANAVDFRLGCVTSLPSGNTAPTDITPGDAAVADCRNSCAMQGAVVAFLQDGVTCSCWASETPDTYMADLNEAACSTASVWVAYWVSNVQDAIITPINLAVTVEMPTANDYIRPNETVTFHMSIETDETVTFFVDFQDGTTKVTTDARTSHYYLGEGDYNVNITAVTRTNHETVVEQISITWVEEGVAPELVEFSASQGPSPHQVLMYAAAVSGYPMTCIINVGQGSTIQTQMDSFANEAEESFAYDVAGIYDTDLTCTNEYGEKSAHVTVVASDYELEFQTDETNVDIVVPIVGANTHLDSFLVYLDEQEVDAAVSETEVTVSAAVIASPGDHILALQSSNTSIHRRVLNIQQPIESVSIVSIVSQTESSMPTQLLFTINGGSHVHAQIDYGDGTTENMYFPEAGDAPRVLNRTHTYGTLGGYIVRFKTANDVSYKSTSFDVSIERPIQTASMSAGNVTDLGTPTVFTMVVDPDMSPAMPFMVLFDYGNGETETVRLGQLQTTPAPVIHNYIYPDYGIFTVTATVFNNLSSVETTCLHQVGQNISYVDLYASAERVEVGQEISITVDSPTGSPIEYNIDMGDGTTITVHYPPLDEVEDIANEGSGDAGDAVSNAPVQRRRRRQAEEVIDITSSTTIVTGSGHVLGVFSTTIPPLESSTTVPEADNNTELSLPTTTPQPETTTPYVPPNERMVVSYRYTSPGDFVVRATVYNSLTSAETWLCPDIMVLPTTAPDPQCSSFDVNVDLSGSAVNTPYTIMRSEELVVPTETMMECGGNELDYEADYSWKTEWLTDTGDWRPELEVCAAESISPALTIPANSLWYGTYRLTVTSGIRLLHDAASRRRRAAGNDTSASTNVPTTTTTTTTTTAAPMLSDATMMTTTNEVYVQVEPSDLVADLRGEDAVDVTIFEVIPVYAVDSYDPDVTFGNKTGMTANLFCWQQSLHPDYDSMSQDSLIDQAIKLRNNSAGTVALYDVDCFVKSENVWILGWDFSFPGDHLSTDGELKFKLFVNKDIREATDEKIMTVWTTNSTDPLANLAALLNSNDTSAALLVINLVTGALNDPTNSNDTDAAAERTEVRTILIDALGSVSNNVNNLDQLTATSGVLSGVTAVPSEVTDTSKATAAGAMANTANMATGLTEEADIGLVEGMAGDMVGVASNILPFAETEEEPEAVEPTPIYMSSTFLLASTTPFPDIAPAIEARALVNASVWIVNGSYYPTSTPPPTTITTLPPPTTIPVAATTSTTAARGVTTTTLRIATTEGDILEEAIVEEEGCCEPLQGLCEWIEPECPYLDEEDRKSEVWDNQTCAEIHPDDMAEINFRYELYKAVQKKHLYDQRRTTTTGAMSAVSGLGDILLSKSEEGSNITLESPRLKMEVARISGGNVADAMSNFGTVTYGSPSGHAKPTYRRPGLISHPYPCTMPL